MFASSVSPPPLDEANVPSLALSIPGPDEEFNQVGHQENEFIDDELDDQDENQDDETQNNLECFGEEVCDLLSSSILISHNICRFQQNSQTQLIAASCLLEFLMIHSILWISFSAFFQKSTLPSDPLPTTSLRLSSFVTKMMLHVLKLFLMPKGSVGNFPFVQRHLYSIDAYSDIFLHARYSTNALRPFLMPTRILFAPHRMDAAPPSSPKMLGKWQIGFLKLLGWAFYQIHQEYPFIIKWELIRMASLFIVQSGGQILLREVFTWLYVGFLDLFRHHQSLQNACY